MTAISVISPVYKVEKEIRECLETLQNQTFTDFEVLCVDDCGNDGSAGIVEEFARKDKRFKLLRHEKNRGVSAARNTALDAAAGKYIVFVDPDDWVELNALEVIYNAFEQSKQDSVVYGYYSHDAEGIKKFEQEATGTIFMNPSLLKQLTGCVWNKAFTREAIKKFGVRFPEGYVIEDSEFTFKVFAQLPAYYLVTDCLYHYRAVREGSITTDDILNDRLMDWFGVLNRMLDFALEKDLFIKYRLTFLLFFQRIAKSIKGTPNKKNTILKLADDFLNKMNFPDAFSDFRTDGGKITIWKN